MNKIKIRVVTIISLSVWLTTNAIAIEISPRQIRSVSNGQVVYEGPEKTESDDLWNFSRKSFAELSIQGKQDAQNSIAILVYPASLFPKAQHTQWWQRQEYNNNRLESLPKSLGEKGIELDLPVKRDVIAENYGYLVKYEPAKKQYETLFFTPNDSPIFKYHFFTEEKIDPNWTGVGGNNRLFKNISESISKKLVRYYLDKNYKVLDLTQSQDEFKNVKPFELGRKVNEKYQINQLLLVAYSPFTKWTLSKNSYEQMSYIGLRISYGAVLYAIDKPDPIFVHAADVDAPYQDEDRRFNFYTADNMKNGKVIPGKEAIIYKDGVMDDGWLIGKALEKLFDDDESNRIVSGLEKGLFERLDALTEISQGKEGQDTNANKFWNKNTTEYFKQATLASNSDLKKVTGQDWLLMSHDEKVDLIKNYTSDLQNKGIYCSKTAVDYVNKIDSISLDPKFLSAEVYHVLMKQVYISEPSAKKAIDKRQEMVFRL